MSAPRFRAGQIVEIVGLPALVPNLNGKRFTLAGAPVRTPPMGWCWWMPEELHRTFVHLQKKVVLHGISEMYLRPLYDGDAPARWEDCEWKPTSVPGPEEKKDLSGVCPTFLDVVDAFAKEFVRATAYPRPPELATPEKIRRGE